MTESPRNRSRLRPRFKIVPVFGYEREKRDLLRYSDPVSDQVFAAVAEKHGCKAVRDAHDLNWDRFAVGRNGNGLSGGMTDHPEENALSNFRGPAALCTQRLNARDESAFLEAAADQSEKRRKSRQRKRHEGRGKQNNEQTLSVERYG